MVEGGRGGGREGRIEGGRERGFRGSTSGFRVQGAYLGCGVYTLFLLEIHLQEHPHCPVHWCETTGHEPGVRAPGKRAYLMGGRALYKTERELGWLLLGGGGQRGVATKGKMFVHTTTTLSNT